MVDAAAVETPWSSPVRSLGSEIARTAEGASIALLLTTSFVTSLIMLDSNVVAVSLPAFGRSLHAGSTKVQGDHATPSRRTSR
jgi:hypothetical protein